MPLFSLLSRGKQSPWDGVDAHPRRQKGRKAIVGCVPERTPRVRVVPRLTRGVLDDFATLSTERARKRVRYDDRAGKRFLCNGQWPELGEKPARCKHCYATGKGDVRSKFYCSGCKVHLCIKAGTNCYREWHEKHSPTVSVQDRVRVNLHASGRFGDSTSLSS